MTVKKFAEVVLELVGRNTSEFQVDERVVIATAELIILNILKRQIDSRNGIPASYFKRFTFPIQYDSNLQRKYFEFNPPVMPIGDNDGIAFIGSKTDEYHTNASFILLKPSQIAQYATLEAQHLGGRVGVRPEGNRGYLYNQHPLLDEVSVLMIPQITHLKLTDEMFGLDLSVYGITEPDYVLKATVNYIRGKRGFPEDKLTDSQSN